MWTKRDRARGHWWQKLSQAGHTSWRITGGEELREAWGWGSVEEGGGLFPFPVTRACDACRVVLLLIAPGVGGKAWSVVTERTSVSWGVQPASILRITVTF